MYSFESRVRYSECTEDAKLSIESLINYLQDCSTFQSEQLGVGIDFMKAHHFAWFISAWQISIDRLPRFCEPITISTWSTGVRSTEARRNFVISNAEGTPCVRADSVWFVYDTKLKRPVRIPASEHVYDQGDAPLDLPPTSRKIPVEGPFVEDAPIVVGKMHLDTNGHVNNAQYVRMASSALPRPIDSGTILVSYRRMALLGDTIIPHVHDQQESVTVDLTSPSGATYAVVKFEARRTDR